MAAIVLPLLAIEVARASAAIPPGRPLAVLIDATPQAGATTDEEAAARAIDAVDEEAHARGVRPGQRVSEAAALTAGLVIHRVQARAIEAALARAADVAFGVGPVVALGPPDTVWVDVTGASHLWGGEPALLAALEARVQELGHRARGALADGPRLARALARFARHAGVAPIHPVGGGGAAIARLPVRALFLDRAGDDEVVSLLARLGVHRVDDLARLPAAAAAARLGDRAQEVLALARGRDPQPLVPYQPAPLVVEEVSLDDGVESAGALVFVVRALVSRAGGRLAARGEAASRIDLELLLDRSIAALRRGDPAAAREETDADGVVLRPLALAARGAANDAAGAPPPSADLELAIDLPAPLAHESDLLRALKAKIEAIDLPAPVVAVRLALSRITPAPEVQLGLDRQRAGRSGDGGRAVDPDALPALLSELSAEIGAERIGVLAVRDEHRPEARTVLEPPRLDEAPRARRARSRGPRAVDAGSRRASDFDVELLPSPTRLVPGRATLRVVGGAGVADPRTGHLQRGATVILDGRRFVVEHVRFDRRVDGARWWTPAAASRDYLRVWLRAGVTLGTGRSAAAAVEAWIYVDRRTGDAVLQGLWE